VKRDRTFIIAAGVLAAAIVLLWASVLALGLHVVKRDVPLRRPLYLLGDKLGPYVKVSDETLSHDVVDEIGTPRYILSNYRESYGTTGDISSVRFHVAYHSGEPDAKPHVSDRSFVLGAIRPTEPVAETLRVSGEDVPVVRFVFTPQGGRGALSVVYFYMANGRFYTDHRAVEQAVFDLKAGDTWWAKVELHLPSTDAAAVREAATKFLVEALPALRKCLPPEVSARLVDDSASVAVPLPSSAVMGMALLAGVVVITRVPSSARRRRRARR
jgi:hypothetical protein